MTPSTTSVLNRAPGHRGIVVIHEWWGINDNIRSVCQRLADAGYSALAPDLYHGTVASDADEAAKLMGQLDFDRAVEEIRAAARSLHDEGVREVSVLGFCMGGALTLLSALRGAKEFKKAVCFYGIPPSAAGDLSRIQIPVLGHFANQDDWCTPQSVNDLESTLRGGGVKAELHRYDAAHAFANERRPEVHDPDATELAWRRTFEFLEKPL